MRRRRADFEVFSLSAIDLFASAMGAFVIISIILMPDYQKEVMAEGDNTLLEILFADSEDALEDADQRRSEAQSRLSFAQQEVAELMAQSVQLRNELEEAKEQLMADFDPPPPPEPADEQIPDDRVSFRFLGLKTQQRKFLFLVDLNRYMEPHQDLVKESVVRAMDSLKDHHEFSILAYNQLDSGPVYRQWPEGGGLVQATVGNRGAAEAFLESLDHSYGGSSPTVHALEKALESDAGAIVLFSDGLPNPAHNDGLKGSAIVRRVSSGNRGRKEIHAVTIGDYFKYKSTIEFMEALAKRNDGGFMALSQ
jgi:hypothetical protein